VLWAFWHLPFVVTGEDIWVDALLFPIEWSIFYAWLFNNAKGSVLIVMLFHAIDRRPVWWTGAEAGDRSPGSVVDCDCASGLVSSLVINVVVRRPDRLASPWRSVRLGRSGYMAQAERRCRGARLAAGEYRVLRQSEMYDVGVRPSYDRSVSSDIRPSSGVVLRRAGPCGGR
jgi:hypothetical protein